MSQKDEYVIRILDEKEVQLAVDWAAVEGWNPGLNDAAIFYRADPQGFLGGFLAGDACSNDFCSALWRQFWLYRFLYC